MNLPIGSLFKSECNYLRSYGWIPVESEKWMASIQVGIYSPGDTLTHRGAVLATRNLATNREEITATNGSL